LLPNPFTATGRAPSWLSSGGTLQKRRWPEDMHDVISSFNFGSKAKKAAVQQPANARGKKRRKPSKSKNGKSRLPSERQRKPEKHLARLKNGTVRDALGRPIAAIQNWLPGITVGSVAVLRCSTKPGAAVQEEQSMQAEFALDAEPAQQGDSREQLRKLEVQSAEFHAVKIDRLLGSAVERPEPASGNLRDRARKYDRQYAMRTDFYESVFSARDDDTFSVTEMVFQSFPKAYQDILLRAFETLPFVSSQAVRSEIWVSVAALTVVLVAMVPAKTRARAEAALKKHEKGLSTA
jgi:hypothetical protein